MWPCKAQDAFLDREQPGEPPARPQIWLLEGWKAGRMGGVDAGLKLDGSRNLQ